MSAYRYSPKQYKPRLVSDFAKDVFVWVALLLAMAFIAAQLAFS